MTLSDFRNITDELLSAYIDDEVTEQERSLVEEAIAADEVIAWRVDSLRQTVNMLQDLPELAIPRSFTLSFEQLNATQNDGQLAGVAAEKPPVEQHQGAVPLSRSGASVGSSPGFWEQLRQGWREFWQAGNPLLRNAAAVSFALMIMLTSGGPVLMRAFMQPVRQSGEMSASAPSAAPAADIVALVPAVTEPAVTEEVQAAIQESPNESAQSQEADAAGKQGADANARIMSADAESDVAESSEAASITQDAPTEEVMAEGAEESVEEAAPVEDTAAEDVVAESAVTEGETAVAEADSATETEAPVARVAPQPEAAAAMMAPPPGMGGGSGGEGRGGDGMGAMGGGMEVAPGFGGQEQLVPSDAYSYDEAPVLPQTPIPAEEAVVASVAAVPEEERVPVETEAANETTARMAVPESSVAQPTQSESIISESVSPEDVSPESSTSDSALLDTSVPEQPAVEPTVEPIVEPTVDPTAAAVALLAPEEITSSDVVQDVSLDSTAIVTTGARNLPLLWVAQGGTFLLTIVLASLWWRSRRPHRLGRDR